MAVKMSSVPSGSAAFVLSSVSVVSQVPLPPYTPAKLM